MGSSTGGAPEPVDAFDLSKLCLTQVQTFPWPDPVPQAVRDIDGDARADLVAVEQTPDTSQVTVFMAHGSGFAPSPVQTGFDADDSERFEDVDGDGRADLLVLGAAVQVHLGQPDGTFRATEFVTPLSDYRSVDFLDFDGDGVLDMVAADYEDEIQSLRGNGDGTFELAARTSVTSHASANVFASRSGGPAVGLLVGVASGCLSCDDSAFSLSQVEPDGTLVPVGVIEWGAAWSTIMLTVAELGGDDTAEVIVDLGLDQRSVFGQTGGELDVIDVLPNGPLAFGDLNADGVDELVIVTDDRTLNVYDGRGPELAQVLGESVPAATEVFMADIDGNATDDVVMVDPVGFDPDTGDLEPAIYVRLALPCQ